MGVTVNPNGPATVDHARVDGVNLVNMTVDVTTTFTHRQLTIPYMVPYTHGNHGGGINFMPEVGSHCYVCIPSDETAFVLGFIQNPKNLPMEVRDEEDNLISVVTDSGPNFSGFRHPLEPGDIMLSATDDNFIILRRGGVLQIGSTALAQRVYIPIENTVRDFFQRYQAYSPLGEIEWGHAALTTDDDMSSARNTPVLVKYNIKAKAQEDVTEGKFTVEVRAGTLDNTVLDTATDSEHVFANENLRQVQAPTLAVSGIPRVPPPTIPFPGIDTEGTGALSVTIYSHDDSQKRVTYAFQVNTRGDCFLRSEASIHVEVADTLYVKADKGVKIDFGATSTLELLDNEEFRTKVRSMVLEAMQSITISAPAMTIGPGQLTIAASMGGAISFSNEESSLSDNTLDLLDEVTRHYLVVDRDLFAKLINHTHPIDPNTGTALPSPGLVGLDSNRANIKSTTGE